ncbi:MAG TPA: GNAT family N-acetyltransferase [Thermoleophilaceae bacterium]
MLRRVRIRDGTEVGVRPIEPTDAGALRDGFERLSLESRYERFLSPMDHMSTAMVRYFTDVDHHDHEALVAFDPDEDSRLVGVARYVRELDDPEVAEAAITVADDWHRRGLGTALLDAIAERAREEGVKRFTAYVLARNDDMIEMLFRLGPAKIVDRANGAVQIEAELPPAGVSDQLRALLRMAAEMTKRFRPA